MNLKKKKDEENLFGRFVIYCTLSSFVFALHSYLIVCACVSERASVNVHAHTGQGTISHVLNLVCDS